MLQQCVDDGNRLADDRTVLRVTLECPNAHRNSLARHQLLRQRGRLCQRVEDEQRVQLPRSSGGGWSFGHLDTRVVYVHIGCLLYQAEQVSVDQNFVVSGGVMRGVAAPQHRWIETPEITVCKNEMP